MFGMVCSPWLDEPVLDHILHSARGQDFLEDEDASDLAYILDLFEIDENVRKDKQFQANVIFLSSFWYHAYMYVSSFCLGFGSTGARLSQV